MMHLPVRMRGASARLTVAAMAVVASVAVAPAASANMTASLARDTGTAATSAAAVLCHKGAMCTYTKPNFRGNPAEVYGNNANLFKLSPKFRHAESVSNNGRRCTVIIYSKTHYRGAHVRIKKHYVISNLHGTPWYHSIGSNKWSC